MILCRKSLLYVDSLWSKHILFFNFLEHPWKTSKWNKKTSFKDGACDWFFATYVCAFFSTTYFHFSMWKITKKYIVLPFFLKHLRFMNKSNIYQTRSLKVPFILCHISYTLFCLFPSFWIIWLWMEHKNE